MAQNNLAREIFQQAEPTYTPTQPVVPAAPKTQTETKVGISTFEKVLFAVGALVCVAMMIFVVSAKIALTNAQHELQQVDDRISTVHSQNTNYKQQIGELQSSNRLEKIAKDSGMSLSNANIRNVTK